MFDDIRAELAQVEKEILRYLHTDVPLLNDLAHYIFDSGGKRTRPAVAIYAGRMFQAQSETVVAAAGALEYLHTATLLHDDVVDEGNIRRGRIAARLQWGNPQSVLVGDYLFARAFRSFTTIGNVDLLDTVSDTVMQMAKGEILQLIHRFDSASEEEYLSVIGYKTASLFAAAARSGAALGNSTHETRAALQEYGYALGIAFQIADDLLDYTGESTGKDIGQDLRERKLTLPLTRLLAALPPKEKRELLQLLAQETIQDAEIRHVIALMHHYGIVASAREAARTHMRKGLERLRELPASPSHDALEALAHFVVERQN